MHVRAMATATTGAVMNVKGRGQITNKLLPLVFSCFQKSEIVLDDIIDTSVFERCINKARHNSELCRSSVDRRDAKLAKLAGRERRGCAILYDYLYSQTPSTFRSLIESCGYLRPRSLGCVEFVRDLICTIAAWQMAHCAGEHT